MRGVAIVPTYRNLRTLPTVIAGLEESGLPVLVVDDGSDDGTGPWLDHWIASRGGADTRCWLSRLPRNRGKGAALEVGLARARELGFTFAIAVDSDGQHLLEDVLHIASLAAPGVLMQGTRGERISGYPVKSLFGRRLWALGVRSLTGLGVSDPICGLRCYPLHETALLVIGAGRYAWEAEFLVRAAWAGIEIREVGVQAVYFAQGERVSHFALFDWVDSLAVWLRLAALRVVCAVPAARPRGALTARDRSWRRLAACAGLVGVLCGALPFWQVLFPILVWLAWRLYAPVILTIALFALAVLLAEATSSLVALLLALPVAVGITRGARFLCSN